MDLFYIEGLMSVFLETLIVITTGLMVTGNGEWKFKLFLKLAVISWILNSLVRMFYELFGVPLGTHTIIISITMIIVLRYVGKFTWFRSSVSILISFVLLFLGEGLVFYNSLRLLNMSFEELFSITGGRLIGQLLTDSLMILCIIIMLGRKGIYELKNTNKGI